MIDEARIRRSVAKIESSDQQGTGCFISPTMLLTCAHVVKARAQASGPDCDGACKITFERKNVTGKVIERLLFETQYDRQIPYPDLALVEIDSNLSPEVISFQMHSPAPSTKVYACGFPRDEINTEVFAADMTLGGQASAGISPSSELLHLSSGFVRAGMSGAPLFTQSGSAVGLLSYSLKFTEARGGFAIPASTIHTYIGVSNLAILAKPSRIVGLDMRDAVRWLSYAMQEGDGFFQRSYLERICDRLVRRVLEDRDAFEVFKTERQFDVAVRAVQSLQQSLDNVQESDYLQDNGADGRHLRPQAARGVFEEAVSTLQTAIRTLLIDEDTNASEPVNERLRTE